MAVTTPVTVGFVMIAILLLSVLGAVHRLERLAFVGGVILVSIGSALGGVEIGSVAVGGIIAAIGFLTVVASTIPLLRQSPTTS